MTTPYFHDDLHALKTGMAIGAMQVAGLDVIAEQDDLGNYTGVITMMLLGAKVEIRVLP